MNDILKNNQSDPAKPVNSNWVNDCPECKKNPCVCPSKISDSRQKTSGEEDMSKENPPRTKPPKLTWI